MRRCPRFEGRGGVFVHEGQQLREEDAQRKRYRDDNDSDGCEIVPEQSDEGLSRVVGHGVMVMVFCDGDVCVCECVRCSEKRQPNGSSYFIQSNRALLPKNQKSTHTHTHTLAASFIEHV